jgi:hypothetical protein
VVTQAVVPPPPPPVESRPQPAAQPTPLDVRRRPPPPRRPQPDEPKPADPRLKKKGVAVKPPAPPVAPPVAKRRVTIGALPHWSYFTVDSDPAQHTSGEPLELAPGPHTLHFTGQPHYRADKTVTIDVPDADGFKTVVQLEATAPAP